MARDFLGFFATKVLNLFEFSERIKNQGVFCLGFLL